MGLPSIVTNYSGQTEFLHPSFTYPINVEAITQSNTSDAWLSGECLSSSHEYREIQTHIVCN